MRCLFLVFFSRLLFFLPLSISDCFNLIHRLHLQSVLSITIPLLLHHLSSSSVPFFLCSLSLSLSLRVYRSHTSTLTPICALTYYTSPTPPPLLSLCLFLPLLSLSLSLSPSL